MEMRTVLLLSFQGAVVSIQGAGDFPLANLQYLTFKSSSDQTGDILDIQLTKEIFSITAYGFGA